MPSPFQRILRLIRQIACELQSINQQIGHHHKDLMDMRKLLQEIYINKKELVEKYNGAKEIYLAWLRNNRNEKMRFSGPSVCNHSYPATFPVVSRQHYQKPCMYDHLYL